MFNRLGRLVTAHPWLVGLAWVALGVVLTGLAPAWESRAQDDDLHFLPERCASVRGYHLLAQAFPREVYASTALIAVERRDRSLTAADFALVDQLVADLEELRRGEETLQINGILSYRDGLIGGRLVSADRRCTLIQVALATPFLALQTRDTLDRVKAVLRHRLGEAADAPQLYVTGQAGVGHDLTEASASSLEATTLATVLLVVIILLLVYRAPLLALVPLATIGVSVWVALKLLALFTLVPGVHLVNVSKVFAIVILYGAGTDYCLFLISRYREYLEAGASVRAAIRGSVARVGGALAASAGTVVCGLGMMGFAEFAKVRCAGPAIAVSLAVGLVASLTLAPALLRLLGPAVFWPRGLPVVGPRPRDALWNRISHGVVAQPVLIWSAAMLTLAPLVVLGLRVRPAHKPTGELAVTSQSVQGLHAIQRHFTAGETGPVTVLLASETDWDRPAGRELIAHLSRGFARLENVAEVRSLTQPLGSPLPDAAPREPATSPLLRGLFRTVQRQIDSGLETARRAARQHYVADVSAAGAPRFVTRLDVVMKSDPFDAPSKETLTLLQTWLREQLPLATSRVGPVQSECYGVTVNAHDLAEITDGDRLRINWLVLGGILVILLLLVRKPWLALYLLATVLLSYYATLGATSVLATVWTGRPLGEVDWRVPFFLFTILIAVGEDYNILLITRALQESGRHGADEGMRRALARTGGTITSCGLIMAGTFATLMLAGLSTLVQVGFALAFGVLLDTFIVRPFLVPAFTLLFWRDKRRPAARPAPTPAVPLRRAA
jgi:RND superfamily putative drug exporter